MFAQTMDAEQHMELMQPDSQAVPVLYTTTLYVNVSCRNCGFLGATTLSKSHESKPDDRREGSAHSDEAQAGPLIDPDSAIGIILDRLKNPKHRRTAPW